MVFRACPKPFKRAQKAIVFHSQNSATASPGTAPTPLYPGTAALFLLCPNFAMAGFWDLRFETSEAGNNLQPGSCTRSLTSTNSVACRNHVYQSAVDPLVAPQLSSLVFQVSVAVGFGVRSLLALPCRNHVLMRQTVRPQVGCPVWVRRHGMVNVARNPVFLCGCHFEAGGRHVVLVCSL